MTYPINDTLGNIAEIIQGHQITDEEIYNSEGTYPIFTGANAIKGYWGKTIISSSKLPCLTYATKAFDGTITIQNNLFDANNTAVLFLKEPFKEVILIEWLKNILPKKFFEVMTSKSGVSYLNKEIVKNIKIEIPSKDEQLYQIQLYNRSLRPVHVLDELLKKYLNLREKSIEFHYSEFQAMNVKIKDCITYISGTSDLTEEKIYLRQNHIGSEYTVLSGSLNLSNNLKVILMPNEDIPRFEEKEGLLVVRKGKAGHTLYLPPDKYTLNDDAYILYVKENCKYKINLKWLSINYRHVFQFYGSNSDNGTWNMTGFFKYTTIDIPSYEEQQDLILRYEKVEKRIMEISKIKDKYLELLHKEIINH